MVCRGPDIAAAEGPSVELVAGPRGRGAADGEASSNGGSSGSESSSNSGGSDDDEAADLDEDALLEDDMEYMDEEDLDQYRWFLPHFNACILHVMLYARQGCFTRAL